MVFRFGPYDLESETGELRKSGVRIRLGGQPLEVLTLLVERNGEVVTREELKEALWKQESFTDFDHGVNTTIQRIRRALGESAQSPRFIETMPRKGYRFMAAVETPRETHRGRQWVPPTAALVLAAILAVIVGFKVGTEPPARLKFALAPGEDVHDPEISPDGLRIAYVTYKDGGALWVLDTDKTEPSRIRNSEGALRPFWSPDSRSVGFGARGSLWRVDVEGAGPPREISKLFATYQGASWSRDGEEIVVTNGLVRVPASGGVGVRTEIEMGLGYSWDPELLPIEDRTVVLFHRLAAADNRIMLVDLDRRVHDDLGPGRAPVYSPTGHILYQDAGLASRIWAQSFSLETLSTTGEPFLVADNAFAPSVSDDGTLAYIDGDAASVERLVWRDRFGSKTEVASPPLPEARFVDLSPNGETVALSAAANGMRHVWTVDVKNAESQPRQFTFGEPGALHNIPQWSPPPGDRIVYLKRAAPGDQSAWIKPTNGGEAVRAFSSPQPAIVSDFWRDGEREYLVVHAPIGDPKLAWILKYGEVGADGKVALRPLLDTTEIGVCAKISPDGKHIAYIQGEMLNGRPEPRGVMVRTFPDGLGPWPVSPPGEMAAQPRWSPLGDEILYVSGDRLIAAKVSTTDSFRVEGREELFRSQGLAGHAMPMYDISPDGQRIILLDPVPAEEPTLRVSQHWYEDFRDRERE